MRQQQQPKDTKENIMIRSLVCLLLLLAVSVLQAEPDQVVTVKGAKPQAPHHVTSEVCKACHLDIYNQWAGSMHANSTALKDPIHGFMYRKVMGDPLQEDLRNKKGQYPVCLKCHAPAAAMDRKTSLDTIATYNEGVNCITCHLLKSYKGPKNADGKLQLGTDAYEISSTHLQGGSGKVYTTLPTADTDNPGTPSFHPFPMEPNPGLLKSNDLCLGCHYQRNNSKGVPLCQTGPEYVASDAFTTCQSCHMPVVNGVASHVLGGGHDKGMVSKGLVMKMVTASEGDTVKATISLHNKLPHRFPTGAPFRNFYVKVTAFDAEGNRLWQNFETHPMKEDPDAMFMYKLGDEQGKPAGPPVATQVLGDTRLKPNETRELVYSIPAEGVSFIRAEALYNLLLPSQHEAMREVLTDALRAPVLAAAAEATIP
jgi:hypothetical protein